MINMYIVKISHVNKNDFRVMFTTIIILSCPFKKRNNYHMTLKIVFTITFSQTSKIQCHMYSSRWKYGKGCALKKGQLKLNKRLQNFILSQLYSKRRIRIHKPFQLVSFFFLFFLFTFFLPCNYDVLRTFGIQSFNHKMDEIGSKTMEIWPLVDFVTGTLVKQKKNRMTQTFQLI